MAALNPARTVFNGLHDLVKERLADRHRGDWLSAPILIRVRAPVFGEAAMGGLLRL